MQLRFSEIQFVPRLLPTLAALCALSLTLYMGYWQQGRAEMKRALQSEFEARAAASAVVVGAEMISDPLRLRYSRGIARGEWLASGQIFLDNKFDGDSVGFHVITPLKIEGTNRHVLVNCGWVARGTVYPAPPAVSLSPGPVVVEGVLVVPSNKFLELAPATVQGNVWQNLTVERYQAASGLDILPLVLLAETTGAGLRPVLERPDARAEKNVEYMLTWYSLAATVLALWVALNVKIEPVRPKRPVTTETTAP